MSHKLKVIIQFDNIQLCKTQEVCLATPGRITKLKMLSHETHLFFPYLPLLKIDIQDHFLKHYQTVRQWIVGKFLVQSFFLYGFDNHSPQSRPKMHFSFNNNTFLSTKVIRSNT